MSFWTNRSNRYARFAADLEAHEEASEHEAATMRAQDQGPLDDDNDAGWRVDPVTGDRLPPPGDDFDPIETAKEMWRHRRRGY